MSARHSTPSYRSTHSLQVVDGLAYLAEQGMEHSALACSNILVSKGGAVKIGWSVPPANAVLTDTVGQESVTAAVPALPMKLNQ
jgi:hypothetical protein